MGRGKLVYEREDSGGTPGQGEKKSSLFPIGFLVFWSDVSERSRTLLTVLSLGNHHWLPGEISKDVAKTFHALPYTVRCPELPKVNLDCIPLTPITSLYDLVNVV